MGLLEPIDPRLPERREDTVSPRTAERILQGVPENTQRSYVKVQERFEAWCEDNQRQALPTSAAILADYVSHLCDLGRAPSTVQHAMAVISAQNQAAGYPALGKEITKAATLALRGYRREYANAGGREKQAPPITFDILTRMLKACDPSTLAGKRDKLILIIGFALAGRRSELAVLNVEDVTPDGYGGLDVLVRSSKADKDSAGEIVNIPAGDHVDTDPVGILEAWLDGLAQAGQDPTHGRLFRAITRHDRPYRHGSLSPDAINTIVRRTAMKAGLPNWQLFTGHSMRAGFATESSNRGIPVSVWAEHGRWSKTSPVPLTYVRRADRRMNNPLKKMGF